MPKVGHSSVPQRCSGTTVKQSSIGYAILLSHAYNGTFFTVQSRFAAYMASAAVASFSSLVPNPCQGSCPTYIMEALPSATCIRCAISRLPFSLLAARFGDPSGGPAIPLAMEPTVKPIEVHCGDHGATGAASAGYNQYG